MKLPVLVLVILLMSTQVFVTGSMIIPGSVSATRTPCCNHMADCKMNDKTQNSGMSQCNCKIPSTTMAPCNCGCSGNGMMANTQGISDRVRQFIMRGYRRIFHKNILTHPSRSLLFSLICDNPGIDILSLASLSGINEHTIKYHIDRIVNSGHVSINISCGTKHFFENHGTFTQNDQILLSRLHEDSSCKILKLVKENPGISRGDLADMLGVSGPVITRSMYQLIDEGLIHQIRDGKYKRYYPNFYPGNILSCSSFD
jgi:hypothetical protein